MSSITSRAWLDKSNRLRPPLTPNWRLELIGRPSAPPEGDSTSQPSESSSAASRRSSMRCSAGELRPTGVRPLPEAAAEVRYGAEGATVVFNREISLVTSTEFHGDRVLTRSVKTTSTPRASGDSRSVSSKTSSASFDVRSSSTSATSGPKLDRLHTQNAATERPSRCDVAHRSAHMHSSWSTHGTPVLRSVPLRLTRRFCAALGEHGKPRTGITRSSGMT
jgi:hypothetical protein